MPDAGQPMLSVLTKFCSDCGVRYAPAPYQRRCDACIEQTKPGRHKPNGGHYAKTLAKQAKAHEMRSQGASLREIGLALGVTGEWVRQLLVGTNADRAIRGLTAEGFDDADGARFVCVTCPACRHAWRVKARGGLVTACAKCGKGSIGDLRHDRCKAKWAGRRFGDWLVTDYIDGHWVVCRCVCGLEKPVTITTLRSGTSKGCRACGLKRREMRRAQGLIYLSRT